MDNDLKIKKILVSYYKKIKYLIQYRSFAKLSAQEGNDYIGRLLDSEVPFMIARFGAVEMRCVARWLKKQEYTSREREQALYQAGIFPNCKEVLDGFCETYIDALKVCDGLGIWQVKGEASAIKKFCESPIIIPSRSIEPYYHERPWSQHLENKKVLIVHPFIDSIEKQLQRRKEIWKEKEMLPSMKSVQFVKAVQSNGGAITDYRDWFEAFEYMKAEIEKKDFDIAIIGAGAYGLPLAAYVKSLGKQAIQMSGATQILFGIKGKRWDSHPIISKFYNDTWIRPLDSETPPSQEKVEGGSYW